MEKLVCGIDNDEKYYMYSRENEIAKIIKKKLCSYGASSKERVKKQNEFFHLMCFFELNNKYKEIDFIIPHEPGDFLLDVNEKKEIIEVVECYGGSENYIEMKNRLDCVFNRNSEKYKSGIYKFFIKDFINQFKLIFMKKNDDNKSYLSNNDYTSKILLIVTSEFDNCAVTGSCVEKYVNEECFDINKYDKIWILNYFSSGMDNDPTILTDAIIEVKNYKNIINSE